MVINQMLAAASLQTNDRDGLLISAMKNLILNQKSNISNSMHQPILSAAPKYLFQNYATFENILTVHLQEWQYGSSAAGLVVEIPD